MQIQHMSVALSHLSIYGGLQPDWPTEFSHILYFKYDHIWSGMPMEMLLNTLSSL